MKKFKLFLVSSVLAVGFLSNSVNAMQGDEELDPLTKSISYQGVKNVLSSLSIPDIVHYAQTTKAASKILHNKDFWSMYLKSNFKNIKKNIFEKENEGYMQLLSENNGQYVENSVSLAQWALEISPFMIAASHQEDHDQFIKNGEKYRDATKNFPGSIDLRLAIMDNLPSFHHNQNFTFQINRRAWSISDITFYNFPDSGYPAHVRGIPQGNQLTMGNILNIVAAPVSYEPRGAWTALAQFGRGGRNYGTFTVSSVEE